MYKKVYTFGVYLCLFLFTPVQSAFALPAHGVKRSAFDVVGNFGDSLSDPKRISIATNGDIPRTLTPLGKDFPGISPYEKGFSNGKFWAELLGNSFSEYRYNPDINFSQAGAKIGDENLIKSYGVKLKSFQNGYYGGVASWAIDIKYSLIGSNQQVEEFINAFNPNHLDPKKRKGFIGGRKPLATFWLGANNFYDDVLITNNMKSAELSEGDLTEFNVEGMNAKKIALEAAAKYKLNIKSVIEHINTSGRTAYITIMGLPSMDRHVPKINNFLMSMSRRYRDDPEQLARLEQFKKETALFSTTFNGELPHIISELKQTTNAKFAYVPIGPALDAIMELQKGKITAGALPEYLSPQVLKTAKAIKYYDEDYSTALKKWISSKRGQYSLEKIKKEIDNLEKGIPSPLNLDNSFPNIKRYAYIDESGHPTEEGHKFVAALLASILQIDFHDVFEAQDDGLKLLETSYSEAKSGFDNYVAHLERANNHNKHFEVNVLDRKRSFVHTHQNTYGLHNTTMDLGEDTPFSIYMLKGEDEEQFTFGADYKLHDHVVLGMATTNYNTSDESYGFSAEHVDLLDHKSQINTFYLNAAWEGLHVHLMNHQGHLEQNNSEMAVPFGFEAVDVHSNYASIARPWHFDNGVTLTPRYGVSFQKFETNTQLTKPLEFTHQFTTLPSMSRTVSHVSLSADYQWLEDNQPWRISGTVGLNYDHNNKPFIVEMGLKEDRDYDHTHVFHTKKQTITTEFNFTQNWNDHISTGLSLAQEFGKAGGDEHKVEVKLGWKF